MILKRLGFALLLAFAAAAPGAAQTADNLFRVTLLGSGVPDPSPSRFSASTLIEAGAQKLLIDVGRGATIRLFQIHIPLSKIDTVFFTHYHSDHTVGLPDLLLTGWLPPGFAHRMTPLRVIGPTGAQNLLAGIVSAYSADILGREEEQHLPPEGVTAKVSEFTEDGVVFEKDGVKVTAFTVEHGIKPAVGYRIDYRGRSVLISGDTGPNDNIVTYGTGVDILIHEVTAMVPSMLTDPAFQKIHSIHTTPAQAGTLFTRAHPRLAVFTHIAQFGTPTAPPPTIGDVVSETRATYQGPLAVGEDLMTFDIAQGGIAIYRAAP